MEIRVAAGILAAVVLAGCGGGSSSGALSPNSSVTPSPTPSPERLIVIADYPQSSPETTPTILHLVRLDGTEMNTLTLKPGATTTTARGSRIFAIDQSGALTALHRDGSVEDLGNLGAATLVGSLRASPDGNTWLWGAYDTSGQATVSLGSKGAAARVVEQSHEMTRAVRPFSWAQSGPTVEHGAVGIGGYILFYTATGPVDLVDPVSGTVTAVNHTSDCSFSDRATNGTIACFPHGTKHSLSLITVNGQITTVTLPADRFTVEGAAYFSPNDDQVVVGGATAAGPGQEVFATELVKISDGSIRPLALDGVRPAEGPWGWFSDGSLVVYRPKFAAAGAGVWLVGPTGTITKLAIGGDPIGVLTG
jgi:hypothetical protein